MDAFVAADKYFEKIGAKNLLRVISNTKQAIETLCPTAPVGSLKGAANLYSTCTATCA